jgi:hypothetical protein
MERTKIIVATFGTWLSDQSRRDDPVGHVAAVWVAAEGNRPRVHSPTGILNWLVSDPERAVYEPNLRQAVDEYHAHREGRPLQAVPDISTQGQQDKLEYIQIELASIRRLIMTVMAALGIEAPGADETSPVSQPSWAGLAADWATLAAVADWTEDEAAGGS